MERIAASERATDINPHPGPLPLYGRGGFFPAPSTRLALPLPHGERVGVRGVRGESRRLCGRRTSTLTPSLSHSWERGILPRLAGAAFASLSPARRGVGVRGFGACRAAGASDGRQPSPRPSPTLWERGILPRSIGAARAPSPPRGEGRGEGGSERLRGGGAGDGLQPSPQPSPNLGRGGCSPVAGAPSPIRPCPIRDDGDDAPAGRGPSGAWPVRPPCASRGAATRLRGARSTNRRQMASRLQI